MSRRLSRDKWIRLPAGATHVKVSRSGKMEAGVAGHRRRANPKRKAKKTAKNYWPKLAWPERSHNNKADATEELKRMRAAGRKAKKKSNPRRRTNAKRTAWTHTVWKRKPKKNPKRKAARKATKPRRANAKRAARKNCRRRSRNSYRLHKLSDIARPYARRSSKRNPAKTYKRKYGWGRLAVRADFSQASSPIYYATGSDIASGDFDNSVFQVADARHSPAKALSLVNQWLRRNSG